MLSGLEIQELSGQKTIYSQQFGRRTRCKVCGSLVAENATAVPEGVSSNSIIFCVMPLPTSHAYKVWYVIIPQTGPPTYTSTTSHFLSFFLHARKVCSEAFNSESPATALMCSPCVFAGFTLPVSFSCALFHQNGAMFRSAHHMARERERPYNAIERKKGVEIWSAQR